ncbi:sigma-70 family RNA polymerase sigma factor [Hyphomicrobium sp. D-2]|uniref:sigma-70 family RNA polymerase sigma factor n=1 Tax=Hyphomicrobium sp. D-2 TaxID=3041621 RepID=UPI0024568F39|nr:sigma-70 family RNA polymerase sigma factor [Hyphomicrobium sp. D-2]MDH4981710.1 sigma-70 family RNA polymerase sigma factor [Hyphomicrobium sp. D-2]
MQEDDIRWGVFINHRGPLVDYAAPIVGSRDIAEDVVQDAFLRISSAGVRACNREQVLAYLYRIVRNLSFDLIRRRQIEQKHVQADAPYWVQPQTAANPEEAAVLADEMRIVAEILADLPLEVRIAVEMHRFGQFTLEDIARHLGISVPNAHRYVKMAMLKIATRLENTRS